MTMSMDLGHVQRPKVLEFTPLGSIYVHFPPIYFILAGFTWISPPNCNHQIRHRYPLAIVPPMQACAVGR
ncbi:hypothetical protein AOQ84DRAFT_207631 [Glonium stellatum]|uniref:Uncharacterized protein n=1 Tax=Glonium stellatum TaxID=574774 RepID=A0A8E2JVL2_9PEZI|nr:hypothetical protein AOQ84DRAFT_207631 [Glonium stellatum]